MHDLIKVRYQESMRKLPADTIGLPGVHGLCIYWKEVRLGSSRVIYNKMVAVVGCSPFAMASWTVSPSTRW